MVIERDKKCLECGSTNELTVDHIIPLSRGGVNSPDNLRTLCGPCNRRKGSRIEWEWWERLQMAFHVDAIVDRLKNELKGQIASIRGTALAEANRAMQNEVSKLRNDIKDKDHIVDQQATATALLHDRLRALETHLKIEYVKEVSEFKGYRKIKK